MDYFLQFHWWYLVVGFLLFIVFAKGKGGVVVKRFTAHLEILDPRFAECRPEAKYSKFKEGSPDHIEIELENLFLEPGEELEFWLDGELLSEVSVENDHEAEFDHWSDEGVSFPVINGGEELVIRYQNTDVLKGIFTS